MSRIIYLVECKAINPDSTAAIRIEVEFDAQEQPGRARYEPVTSFNGEEDARADRNLDWNRR